MYRACIAIVDATRARVFSFDQDSDPGGTREKLIEVLDLVHPERRRRPSDLFSDTRPGSGRTGPRQFAFDDHREAHLEQLDAEFARDIVKAIASIMTRLRLSRLIVCAGPRMLGELRAAGLARPGLLVEELARELAKLTAAELRDQLAAYGLLPPRPSRPTFA
jgi:protein required for attachment to host cells